jgi:hypothetical protein
MKMVAWNKRTIKGAVGTQKRHSHIESGHYSQEQRCSFPFGGEKPRRHPPM